MTVFDEMKTAFEEGRRRYEAAMAAKPVDFAAVEEYELPRGEESGSVVCRGDNLSYMIHLIKTRGLAGKLQLIYADPPFFSNGSYEASVRLQSETLGTSELIKIGAYDDRRRGGLREYLTMLTARLLAMRELLAESGCIWVHLDRHAAHYVKVLLDAVFGAENFRNEVIWTYKSGGSGSRSFARKHDNLLFYSRGSGYKFRPLKEKSYNRDLKPYRFKGVEEFCDERGWYTMVNMKDVWSIDMVGRTSSERSGYATQKPEKLLQRIVEACSEEGDLCADFFAGSGTLGVVCEKLNRRWLMCDESRLAVAMQVERLHAAGAGFAVQSDRDGCAGSEKQGRVELSLDGGKITLEKYDPGRIGLGEQRMSGKSAEQLRKYAGRDSLSLLRLWSVDTDHDGSVHRPQLFMPGTQRTCDLRGQSIGEVISIAGYDALGNRFVKLIDNKNGGSAVHET